MASLSELLLSYGTETNTIIKHVMNLCTTAIINNINLVVSNS